MRLTTALSYTGITLGVAAVGYAVYFDYRRRNDPQFRKLLRKQSKQSTKAAKREQKAAQKEEALLIEKAVKDASTPGVLPSGVQEKEAFFMEQVAAGEALFAQGPAYNVPAAIAFFRALKVYPAPVELVMIYQKAVPKEVFEILMQLITKDAALTGSSAGGNLDEVDDEVPGKEKKETTKEAKSEAKPEEAKEETKPEAPKDEAAKPSA